MALLWVDILIFGLYLVAVVIMGCFFYQKEQTSYGFMAAGGTLPGWAVGLSLFGTYLSSNTFIGVTGRAFGYDWSFFVFSLTLPIAAWLGVRYFVPFYRETGEISAYHHMEQRFGGWARTFCVILYLFTQIARIAAIMFGVGLGLHVLTGWSIVTIIIISGISVTLYTMLGGIAAVIWTDVVQAIVLTVGAVLVLLSVLFAMPGGVSDAISTAVSHDKFSLGSLDFSLTSPTIVVICLYGLFMNVGNFAFDQNYVQRFHTAKSTKEAKKAVWLGALLYVPVSALFFFLGTMLYSYYQANPGLLDDLKMQTALRDVSVMDNIDGSQQASALVLASDYTVVDVADRAFPHYLANAAHLPIGFAGLLLAAITAAAMSSIDTSLNSSATIIMRDFYKRYFRPDAEEKELVRVLHVSTLLWGVFGTCAALAMLGVESLLAAWWQLSGTFFGGMFGLFLLGFIVKKATRPAAVIGASAGVCILLWLVFSPRISQLPEIFRSPFHAYMSVIFTSLTIFSVGLLVTRLSRTDQNNYPNNH